ncbi:hypothetical protein [Pseudomonas nitroreducens]|uniref:hypothetical protein n=1 Tax=Pseudomonas nitroreducens TaxID=46680 RepID=UPI00351D1F5F
MTDSTVTELVNLANELYQEGYMCGISGPDADTWIEAWATAMQRVAQGEQYGPDLVYEIFKKLSGDPE